MSGAPTALSSASPLAESVGTLRSWWSITREGFVAAGIGSGPDPVANEPAWIDRINTGLGLLPPETTLLGAVTRLVTVVGAVDRNGDDIICAASLRGTRTGLARALGDPNVTRYFFNLTDDNKPS